MKGLHRGEYSMQGGVYPRTESFLEKGLLSSPWFAVGHVAQKGGSALNQVHPLPRGHHLSKGKGNLRASDNLLVIMNT